MNRTEEVVRRLLVEDGQRRFKTVKVVDLRKKIAGAVWDWMYVLDSGGENFVVFAKESGEQTRPVKVPTNVKL